MLGGGGNLYLQGVNNIHEFISLDSARGSEDAGDILEDSQDKE